MAEKLIHVPIDLRRLTKRIRAIYGAVEDNLR
jgi:hypothetical protein